jgi:hypothetical protein
MRNRLYVQRAAKDLTIQTEATANILMLSPPAPHPPAAVSEPTREPA